MNYTPKPHTCDRCEKPLVGNEEGICNECSKELKENAQKNKATFR